MKNESATALNQKKKQRNDPSNLEIKLTHEEKYLALQIGITHYEA